jgi:hypothetical protein
MIDCDSVSFWLPGQWKTLFITMALRALNELKLSLEESLNSGIYSVGCGKAAPPDIWARIEHVRGDPW